MDEMSKTEITSIDLVVFPDWCGGAVVTKYIDPLTGKQDYFNTFASEELAQLWTERARQVFLDPARLFIHMQEGTGGNSSGLSHLKDYLAFIRNLFEPSDRLIEYNGWSFNGFNTTVDKIREEQKLLSLLKGKGFVLRPEVVVDAYGHHRGDCVPKYGKKAVLSLGLDESHFMEVKELGVGDKVMDQLDIVKEENPAVYWHYSEEHARQLRAQKDYEAIRQIYDARNYLFVYCTPEQVREAAKSATSVPDFEERIGGSFKGFKFLEDYFRLCDKWGHEL